MKFWRFLFLFSVVLCHFSVHSEYAKLPAQIVSMVVFAISVRVTMHHTYCVKFDALRVWYDLKLGMFVLGNSS